MKAQSAVRLIVFLLAAISCTAQQPIQELRFGNGAKVSLLDSAEAAQAIITDATDGFFEKVTASEMSIQMKRPLAADESAAAMRDAYRDFLKSDVENFTADESKFVAEVFESIFKTCDAVHKDIFPANLKLIKTKARHYGESVYYTRESCIIIPDNELRNRDKQAFTSTMFHEVFHVYSRLNPEKRRLLYGLIGFESVGFQNLVIPKPLAERLLFNPDGVDFAQKINLQTNDGKTIAAIPVIFSNHVGYQSGKQEFFGYVEFNLFQIAPEGGAWKVITAADGFSSTLDLKNLPDFFRQIKDNTHYIIHPDEVLADNFSFLMMGKNNPAVTAKFSPAGKKLVEDVETILKGGNPLTKEGRTPSNGSNR